VTFKDLQKLVQSQSGPEQSQLLQRLRDKPFWIWDQSRHKKEDIKTKGDCQQGKPNTSAISSENVKFIDTLGPAVAVWRRRPHG
jgi:hypothetical protein